MDVTDRGKTKVGCQKGRSALLVMLLPNATLAVYLSVRKCRQIKYRMFFSFKAATATRPTAVKVSHFFEAMCVCVRECV